MAYYVVIGLEVHIQLCTKTKVFCACPNKFGAAPNSLCCPVCLGLPGSLPVLNKEALSLGLKVALALNCSLNEKVQFERKHYFYPDLPKNYQISQYSTPLGDKGYLDVVHPLKKEYKARVGIHRVHLEEDAAKLIHPEKRGYSLIDYNRAGTPLLEIVTEPVIDSPELAYAYLVNLKAILEYLGVSDCNMQEGSLRADANISISREKGRLGVKTELKNMNSFKYIQNGLSFEIARQIALLESGKAIVSQTRLWDIDKGITVPMRKKERSYDYRYFPDPDLPIFTIGSQLVEEISSSLPELPLAKKERFIREYNLPEYDAEVLTQNRDIARYYEDCLAIYNRPKLVSNWLMRDILGYLKERQCAISEIRLSPDRLCSLLLLIEKRELSNNMAKDVLAEMLDTDSSAQEIIQRRGLFQISDEARLREIVEEVIRSNPKVVRDYASGKKNAIMRLIGEVMKKTRGRADAQVVNRLLSECLSP